MTTNKTEVQIVIEWVIKFDGHEGEVSVEGDRLRVRLTKVKGKPTWLSFLYSSPNYPVCGCRGSEVVARVIRRDIQEAIARWS